MADADHLVGFALAAVRRAQHLEGAGIAHRAELAPELRGNRPVVGVLHHCLLSTSDAADEGLGVDLGGRRIMKKKKKKETKIEHVMRPNE